jgi:hypothetical protein
MDEFDAKYLNWNQALTHLDMRRKFHDAIANKYPATHPWVPSPQRTYCERRTDHVRCRQMVTQALPVRRIAVIRRD